MNGPIRAQACEWACDIITPAAVSLTSNVPRCWSSSSERSCRLLQTLVCSVSTGSREKRLNNTSEPLVCGPGQPGAQIRLIRIVKALRMKELLRMCCGGFIYRLLMLGDTIHLHRVNTVGSFTLRWLSPAGHLFAVRNEKPSVNAPLRTCSRFQERSSSLFFLIA